MAKFYPVIHVDSTAQTLENLAIALDAGADGVWLIGHEMGHQDLGRVFLECRSKHPDTWLGINFLDLPPHLAMTYVVGTDARVDGLWTDYSGIDDLEVRPIAVRTWDLKNESDWKGLYFGGVAFKGQRPVKDYLQAAVLAARYMDVVCTSGSATGVAAAVEKVEAMAPAGPLALASGVSAENVSAYLPHVSAFLVASSISQGFHHLDPERTRELAERIHQYHDGPDAVPL